MKQCSKCKIWKDEGEFHKNSRTKDGLCSKCKVCAIILAQKWTEDNRKRSRQIKAKWQKNNRQKQNEIRKRWRKANPKKVASIQKKHDAKRAKVPRNKLSRNISRRIRYSLHGNKNGLHWETLVGYTLQELKQHIESQFVEGMSWDNYGEWHIDHQIPISAFNFDFPEDIDFKRCWAIENLKPLWRFENLSKSGKVNKHFQPMLKMKII